MHIRKENNIYCLITIFFIEYLIIICFSFLSYLIVTLICGWTISFFKYITFCMRFICCLYLVILLIIHTHIKDKNKQMFVDDISLFLIDCASASSKFTIYSMIWQALIFIGTNGLQKTTIRAKSDKEKNGDLNMRIDWFANYMKINRL